MEITAACICEHNNLIKITNNNELYHENHIIRCPKHCTKILHLKEQNNFAALATRKCNENSS